MTLRRSMPFWARKQTVGGSGLLNDLVEYWTFDSNWDGIVALTSVNNAGGSTISPAKINDGVQQLTNSEVRYPDLDIFSFTDGVNDLPFSFSFWLNINSFGSTGAWIINKRSPGQEEYQFFIFNSNKKLNVWLFNETSGTSNYLSAETSATFATSTWYHVVITYDGSALASGIKIYINGSLDSSTNTMTGSYTKMKNGTALLSLFRLIGVSSTLLTGIIDEVGIWKDRELNSTEVSELYNSGLGLQYPF